MLRTSFASLLSICIVAARVSIAAGNGGAGHEYDGITVEDGKSRDFVSKQCTLTIFQSEIINRYSKKIIGYNYEWSSFTKLGLVTPVNSRKLGLMPTNKDYVELMEGIGFPLNRMAGASSQTMIWKAAVGSLGERKLIKNELYSSGPLEWIATTLQTDPKAEFVWVLNMKQNSATDARDLAEFFQGSSETEWGQKRISFGIGKPVKISVWELGNELDWGKDPLSVDEYITRAREYIKAIRSVDPNAIFAASATTAPWHPTNQNNWRKWHQKVLAELAPSLGYIAFHPYYWGYSPDYVFTFIDTIKHDISLSDNKDIKIFCSEHAKWPEGGGKNSNRKNWYQTHSLQGCLDTADWIIRCINYPEIAMMTYHCFSSGPWGLVYRDDRGRLYRTGIAEMFKLLGKIPDNLSVLKSFCDDENLSAAVIYSTSDKKYYVLVDNRHNTNYILKLNLAEKAPNLYPEVTYILSAESDRAYNTATAQPIKIEKKIQTEQCYADSLPVYPNSLVLFVISEYMDK